MTGNSQQRFSETADGSFCLVIQTPTSSLTSNRAGVAIYFARISAGLRPDRANVPVCDANGLAGNSAFTL
jgi:hypothetical protein